MPTSMQNYKVRRRSIRVGIEKANVRLDLAEKYRILLIRVTFFTYDCFKRMHVIRIFGSSTGHKE